MFDDYYDGLPGRLVITLNYLLMLASSLVFFLVLNVFWGEYLPLSFDDLTEAPSEIFSGVLSVWFIFVWGIGVTLFLSLVLDRHHDGDARELMIDGTWISVNAGVFEELIYRWLIFFNAMAVVTFINFITLGLVKWIYMEVLIPLANWSTLGFLENQLYHPDGWVIGAALVAASVQFRDAHEYQGLFGWTNSWFMGMIMFFLVFNYGILAAIVAHVLYDIAVFWTAAWVASRTEPRYGY